MPVRRRLGYPWRVGYRRVQVRRSDPMVSAVILLSVEKTRVNEVAEQLVDLPGITEVYSVAGQYDLVAVARVRDNDAIADAVTRQMLKIEGILRSETLIA